MSPCPYQAFHSTPYTHCVCGWTALPPAHTAHYTQRPITKGKHKHKGYTMDDLTLDLEMAYTTYAMSCRDPHITPSGDLRECRRATHHDDDHASGHGPKGRATWPQAHSTSTKHTEHTPEGK